MHLQGCLILSQVDLLFSVNHMPENGADPEICTLLPGLQDPRIAIYAWPAKKLAGTTELASAGISSVTGRHRDYFGLAPVTGTLGRGLTSISDVRSVALCVLSYEGVEMVRTAGAAPAAWSV